MKIIGKKVRVFDKEKETFVTGVVKECYPAGYRVTEDNMFFAPSMYNKILEYDYLIIDSPEHTTWVTIPCNPNSMSVWEDLGNDCPYKKHNVCEVFNSTCEEQSNCGMKQQFCDCFYCKYRVVLPFSGLYCRKQEAHINNSKAKCPYFKRSFFDSLMLKLFGEESKMLVGGCADDDESR